MRVVGAALFGGCVALAAGCGDGEERAAMMTMPALGQAGELFDFCYAYAIHDDAGGLVLSEGDPDALPTTLAEARSGGALCGATAQARSFGCRPNARYTLSVTGGLVAAPDLSIGETCEDGCEVDFVCKDGETIAFDLPEVTIMRPSNQGFIELDASFTTPALTTDVCIWLRVDSAKGLITTFNDEVHCASEYGAIGNDAASIRLVVPCDADEPADNDVTVWIDDLAFGADAQRTWDNPCPTPADGAVDTWTGGCRQTVRCAENADTGVDMSFDLRP